MEPLEAPFDHVNAEWGARSSSFREDKSNGVQMLFYIRARGLCCRTNRNRIYGSRNGLPDLSRRGKLYMSLHGF